MSGANLQFTDVLADHPHRRALVVDDEQLIRWSLRETLIDRGFSVVEADDGRSAVNALTESPRSRT